MNLRIYTILSFEKDGLHPVKNNIMTMLSLITVGYCAELNSDDRVRMRELKMAVDLKITNCDGHKPNSF